MNNLENFELRAYPNPATSVLIVEGLDLSGIISISNLLGEIVLQKNKFDTSQSLDISALPSGVYFLRLESKERQPVIKVVKE
ncbi:MAG: T9SS type A sorting domain-containing protein [Bacteroidota bacterium]